MREGQGAAVDVEVCVLGVLELRVDGQPVELTRMRTQQLLALLAIAPDGRTADALIDQLWSDQLPADPRGALSVVVSRLRSQLGDARDNLRRDGPRYLLDATVDVAEFQSIVYRAKNITVPDDKQALLEQALAIPRDAAFTGVEPVPSLVAEQARIQAAVRDAAVDLLEVNAQQGRNDVVAADGTRLVQDRPDDERVVAIVARALGHLGRRTEALKLVDRCTRTLRNEMGIDPSAAIRNIEQELLHGTVDLQPSGNPVLQIPTRLDFVGRDDQCSALAAETGARVVIGEPGLGKTALLDQIALHRLDQGQQVIRAAARELPGHPMEALAEILETALTLTAEREIDGDTIAALRRVLPGHDFDEEIETQVVTRDAIIGRLSKFLADVLRSESATLIIDDAQWLDATSAAVVDELASMAGAPLLLASRPADPGMPTRFDRAPWMTINLEPLTPDDVAELVAGSTVHVPAELTPDRVVTLTGGNPLFITLLMDMVADGLGSGVDNELPTTILLAVQQRLDTLSGRSRSTLGLAAAIGHEFDVDVLALLAPSADADLLEARQAGLVDAGEDLTTGKARFRHALVRQAIYQQLPEGKRVAAHDRIGSLLEGQGAPATEYVRHYAEAAEFGPLRAAQAHLDAGRAFGEVHDFGAVEHHCRSGRELLSVAPTGAPYLEAQLAVLQGQANRSLHRGGYDEALTRAVELARETDDDVLLGDAAVAVCLQGWSMTGASPTDALDLLAEAADKQTDEQRQARIRSVGATFVMSNENARARAMFEQAMTTALDVGDSSTQAHVLRFAHWGLSHPADLATWQQATTLLADLAGPDADFRWGAATSAFAIGVILGQPDAAEKSLVQLRELNALQDQSHRDWELAHTESAWAAVRGDASEAARLLDQAEELGSRTNSAAWLLPIIGASRIAILRLTGQSAQMLPLLDKALSQRPEFLGWRACVASAAALNGDLERARVELEMCARHDFVGLYPDATWTGITLLLADAVVALADTERAVILRRIMEPYADRMSWSGVCTMGPMAGALAGLCTVLGDDDAAAHHRRRSDSLTASFGA